MWRYCFLFLFTLVGLLQSIPGSDGLCNYILQLCFESLQREEVVEGVGRGDVVRSS